MPGRIGAGVRAHRDVQLRRPATPRVDVSRTSRRKWGLSGAAQLGGLVSILVSDCRRGHVPGRAACRPPEPGQEHRADGRVCGSGADRQRGPTRAITVSFSAPAPRSVSVKPHTPRPPARCSSRMFPQRLRATIFWCVPAPAASAGLGVRGRPSAESSQPSGAGGPRSSSSACPVCCWRCCSCWCAATTARSGCPPGSGGCAQARRPRAASRVAAAALSRRLRTLAARLRSWSCPRCTPGYPATSTAI